jgi:hypothetical protein
MDTNLVGAFFLMGIPGALLAWFGGRFFASMYPEVLAQRRRMTAKQLGLQKRSFGFLHHRRYSTGYRRLLRFLAVCFRVFFFVWVGIWLFLLIRATVRAFTD